MHRPVLIEEAIESLAVKPQGRYIDATVGEGGHLKEFVDRGAQVLAIDWDASQISRLQQRFPAHKQIIFAIGNFADIKKIATEHQFVPDGILFDLGLSMYQITSGDRGFSFKNKDEDLDMRISAKSKSQAKELLNTLDEYELYEIFAGYGEELESQSIAHAVIIARIKDKFKTVGQLTDVIDTVLTRKRITNPGEHERIYSRIFQALRIAVNSEFENLKKGLRGAIDILAPQGRLAVITFHSREDRMVKQFIKEMKLQTVYKKVVKGNQKYKFERSAKLRVVIK